VERVNKYFAFGLALAGAAIAINNVYRRWRDL
jgi:hypothetical protein